MVAYRAARPKSPTMRIGRRGRRSTQTPAGRVKRMNGRKRTVPRAATSNALASRTRIATSAKAMSSIVEPNWLIVSADQSLRKSGWRQSPPLGQTLRIRRPRRQHDGGREERARKGVHVAVRVLGAVQVGDEPVHPALEARQVLRREAHVDEGRKVLLRRAGRGRLV